MGGNPLRDADDRRDAGLGRLVDRVGGKWRGHEHHRGVGAGIVDCPSDRVEYRHSLDVLTSLSRRHTGDEVRSVLLVPEAVEGALTAGEALYHELGALV